MRFTDIMDTFETETHILDDDDMTGDADDQILSHQETMERIKEGLVKLTQDPLLSDLPVDVTLEEISSQIALEYGQSMTINVRRADDKLYPVVVPQAATVRDLKVAIKRHVILKLFRDTSRPQKHISWKYIWRTYWLHFDGQKLTDDRKLIKDYGIRNRDEVKFIKRLQQK